MEHARTRKDGVDDQGKRNANNTTTTIAVAVMPTPMEDNDDKSSDRNVASASSSSSLIQLRDIDCDVAEWWCHYILEQPYHVDSSPLLESVEKIIPRIIPLSKHNVNLIARMRALQIWHDFLKDPITVQMDRLISLLGKEDEWNVPLSTVVQSIQVFQQLLILCRKEQQENKNHHSPKKKQQQQQEAARNEFRDQLNEIFKNEETIPQSLLNLVETRTTKNNNNKEEEEANLQRRILSLIEDDTFEYGTFQVQEATRTLLLDWCNNRLETPRLIRVGYLRNPEQQQEKVGGESHNTAHQKVTLPQQQQQQQQKSPLTNDNRVDSSHTAMNKKRRVRRVIEEKETMEAEESSSSSNNNNKKKEPEIIPLLLPSSSEDDEEVMTRNRSKSVPTFRNRSRKRNRSPSSSRQRSNSTRTTTTTTTIQRRNNSSKLTTMPVAKKPKKRYTAEQITTAIQKGIAQYGYDNNWTLIQKRSGGVLNHLSVSQLMERAKELADENQN